MNGKQEDSGREAPLTGVQISTTLSVGLNHELHVACAIHNIKIKDAVSAAVRLWLHEHPVDR